MFQDARLVAEERDGLLASGAQVLVGEVRDTGVRGEIAFRPGSAEIIGRATTSLPLRGVATGRG
ncbi:hypothetical protein ACIBTP_17000 [Streptomyces avidinii]|uniref:hypothetical protein n=1 Tax=Streptomyces avidinii TaxID=1895 RepID=UPI0037B67C07